MIAVDDAQTLWLLVFIYETRSHQILAKLINQGVAAALFSSTRLKNFDNERIFLCLKIAEIDSQFWAKKNDSRHNNSFF